MSKYVVAIDKYGTPGEPVKVMRGSRIREFVKSQYHNKGSVVELDDAEAERSVERGYLKPVDSAGAEAVTQGLKEATPVDTTSPNVPPGTTVPAPPGPVAPVEETGERLTHKQSLQKEARELGLSTEGTIAELEARIEEEKAQA